MAEWLLATYRHQFGNEADEPDHPNVFAAIAFPSTESLNWNGQGIKDHSKSQADDSGGSIRAFSLVGAVPAPQMHVSKPACVQPDL